MPIKKKKTNYLSNRELLIEIHKSKISYCYYIDEKYHDYDHIVFDLSEITPVTIKQAKENRVKRLNDQLLSDLEKKCSTLEEVDELWKQQRMSINDVSEEDLVFRVMTDEHVPIAKETEEKITRTKTPFPPFKHYILEDGEHREVARSHWRDGLHNGLFDVTHGQITNKLAAAFLKLAERYSYKPSVRNYSYIDEMRNEAILRLVAGGLQFNEAKGSNPFAYYTQAVKNAFRGVLNTEKKGRDIRDELLQQNGYDPSFSTQTDNSLSFKE